MLTILQTCIIKKRTKLYHYFVILCCFAFPQGNVLLQTECVLIKISRKTFDSTTVLENLYGEHGENKNLDVRKCTQWAGNILYVRWKNQLKKVCNELFVNSLQTNWFTDEMFASVYAALAYQAVITNQLVICNLPWVLSIFDESNNANSVGMLSPSKSVWLKDRIYNI